MKYNAASQISLENSVFTGNDDGARTPILMRTESDFGVTTKTKGKKNDQKKIRRRHLATDES